MSHHHLNRISRDLAVEQSLDAAIEVDEVINGRRVDAPALFSLVQILLGSGHAVKPSKRELLGDSRFASLYHRAATSSGRDFKNASDLGSILDLMFRIDANGVERCTPDELSFVLDFCLGLNRELVSEAYSGTPEPSTTRISHQNLTAPYAY